MSFYELETGVDMHLSNIKLWNFRKFGSDGDIDLENPHLSLNFTKGLNVLIGENDSGKSAIIDAIKLVLKTHAFEWIRIADDDFYKDSKRFRIELWIEEFSDDEAKHFTEWLGWAGEGEETKPFLRLMFDVKRTEDRILPSDVRGGVDDEGSALSAEAREYLKATYLKPLRDASSELIPKRNSRLSQIFQEHDAFKGREEDHPLKEALNAFNKSVEDYFEGEEDKTLDKKGKELKSKIDEYIRYFHDETASSEISIAEGSLKKILETLELSLKDEMNPGLGTLNRLFMASELIHLSKANWDGLRLGLIEELEAHLHPQAQMKIIETLQADDTIQLIMTTHSPNLASKVKLKNLIICNNYTAFPMGEEHTELKTDSNENDYLFLERFLDVTKSNLFFARGIIMVEGWSEEILLPALARKLKSQQLIPRDLTEAGVSIINVGSTAFLHYSRIFLRKTEPHMDIPVAIVTDVDIAEYQKQDTDYVKVDQADYLEGIQKNIIEIEEKYNKQLVKAFVAPEWTLEYCFNKSSSLSASFENIVKGIHSGTNFDNFELELAKKLINRGLKKTEIAYQLAQVLDEDTQKELKKRQAQESGDANADELPDPEILIPDDDPTINYLIEAIKYACRN